MLTTVQVHMWAVIIGCVGGLVSLAYGQLLDLLLKVVWHDIPGALDSLWSDRFPSWNYIWMATMTLGALGLGPLLLLFKHAPARMRKFASRTPGGVGELINELHETGHYSLRKFLPMLICSLVAIVAGGSAGPEAAVLILNATLAGVLSRVMKQQAVVRRVLTLCGMSAGLSAFFGLPLGGAIFCLEVPHRMGLQWYEAISPAVLSSIVAVMTLKGVTGEHLGGNDMFPSVPTLFARDMAVGILLGFIGGLIAVVFTVLVRGLQWLSARSGIAKHPMARVIVGSVVVACVGIFYPQTLFWSEKEMQTMLGGGDPPLPNVPLTPFLNVNVPWTVEMFAQISAAKMFTIAVTVVAGFPGGIIFPLFYVGAGCGQVACRLVPGVPCTVAILSLMGAVEAAITRTPWATSIILLQLGMGFYGSSMHYISVFPVIASAVFAALFVTRPIRFMMTQRSRQDIMLVFDQDEQSDQQIAFGHNPITPSSSSVSIKKGNGRVEAIHQLRRGSTIVNIIPRASTKYSAADVGMRSSDQPLINVSKASVSLNYGSSEFDDDDDDDDDDRHRRQPLLADNNQGDNSPLSSSSNEFDDGIAITTSSSSDDDKFSNSRFLRQV